MSDGLTLFKYGLDLELSWKFYGPACPRDDSVGMAPSVREIDVMGL
jgi:hypothetical protein